LLSTEQVSAAQQVVQIALLQSVAGRFEFHQRVAI
jgi:hypothetical protein